MAECTTCKRVLKHEAALLQHCKDKGHPYNSASTSRAPPASISSGVPSSSTAVPPSGTIPLFECKPCGVAYKDKVSYDQHIASKHPPKPFKCAPCGVEFSSVEALSIHYRHFAVHPKCPQCNSAFIDQTQLKLHQAVHPKCTQCDSMFLNRGELEEHLILAHPSTFKCVPCGREFKVTDRQKHYRESPNHPACFVCGEGFPGDSDLDEHLSSAHLESRCRLCNRQFRSAEDLQNHYTSSLAHPHCMLCEVGFANDDSYDKHMEVNHPRPPPRGPSPEPGFHSPGPDTTLRSEISSSLEAQDVPRSTQSSPLAQRTSFTLPTVAVLASVADESEIDDDTYQTVEASSHVQRAISEPTVPTVSSIVYSVQNEVATAWRSPTISDRSLDYADMRGFARRSPSESTISLQSAPTSLSGSQARNGGPNMVDSRQASHISSPVPRIPEFLSTRTESLISQSMSPRPQTPPQDHRYSVSESASSISTHFSRAATPSVRPSLSRQPTPRIPSPVISPVASMRPLSRTAMTPASKGISRPSSSLKSLVAAAPAPELSSDTEDTVPERADTPKPKAFKPKPAAVSWHCRICLQDPCTDPAAAMCGHIFCTACIVQALVKTGSCPVCGKMVLLRLRVEFEP